MLPCVLCVLIQFSHPRLQENLFVGELSRSNSELLTDTPPKKKKLKLNPDKTEFIFSSNCQQVRHDAYFPVSILGNLISPALVIRNFGVAVLIFKCEL